MADGRVVLGCERLDPMVRFFTELGFIVLRIHPADAPREAWMVGHGLTLALVSGRPQTPVTLELTGSEPLTGPGERAPDGTQIRWVDADRARARPELRPELVHVAAGDGNFAVGRAGMAYRDLLPGRLGGRFIASHIRIECGGPVPDHVHHHDVDFQIVFCHRGWVRVVYEDQGPPLLLRAGDVVLQPPGIRHRVLEASDGLEVIEVGGPAEHDTWGDPTSTLPTAVVRPERTWEGQRFVWGRGSEASPQAWSQSGFERFELGVRDASGGVGQVGCVRPTTGPGDPDLRSHGGALQLWFVRRGQATVRVDGDRIELGAGHGLTIPGDAQHTVVDCSDDLDLLEVFVPVARPPVGQRGHRPESWVKV